jgi:hypothetical protein
MTPRDNMRVLPAPLPIDHYALWSDVVAVAKTARSATAGWRAICVRAQRTLGKKVAQPLASLDLDEEVDALGSRVRVIAARAPIEIDTLVFGLFDGFHVTPADGVAVADERGIYTGFHLTGMAGFDDTTRWLPPSPRWRIEDRFLASRALDLIARAGMEARGEPKKAVLHALRFGAAALLARFASEGLHPRIVVAFDDGDFAEVRPRLEL